MEYNIVRCPRCGSTEIGKGNFAGYASVDPMDKSLYSSVFNADICTDCGLVIQIEVSNPSKLKPQK
jgi:transcription elongation factor Elf1